MESLKVYILIANRIKKSLHIFQVVRKTGLEFPVFRNFLWASFHE